MSIEIIGKTADLPFRVRGLKIVQLPDMLIPNRQWDGTSL
jgi:hypothetical protein